ncbi:MAG: hypothetical protein ACYTEL_08650 [Planctomycetota bacterium]|jgi:hypothetical protein
MIKGCKLGKRDLAVMEDLLGCKHDEEKIRVKHDLSWEKFRDMVSNPAFRAEVDRRVEWLKLESEILVARCQSTAATKLAKDTKSMKGKQAWKAYLEIIRLCAGVGRKADACHESEKVGQPVLEPQTARKVLRVLAKKKGKKG